MFERISNTWSLMGASWDVLKRDKRLLLFPLLSGICCLLVLASFAIPIFVAGAWRPPTKQAAAVHHVVYYGTLFAYYFVNFLFITFFNVAIVACAIERMRGGEPDLAFGFREAMARLPLIIGWSLLAATVGLVLRVIEDRSEKVGQIVAGLLGMAWGVVSFLAVPALVVERIGPIATLKSSAALLKRTWGDQLVGNFGFGVILFLFGIPGVAFVGIGAYLVVGSRSFVAGGGFILLAVVYFIALALVQSALQSIFQAAVYLYAADGAAAVSSFGPRGFPVELLRTAMVTK